MSLKPMYDNIIVKPVKAQTKTEGGIYLSNPDKVQQYGEGVVVAVGGGYRVDGKLVPLQVEVGDTILYRKGVEVQLEDDDGNEIFLFSEANTLAIK